METVNRNSDENEPKNDGSVDVCGTVVFLHLAKRPFNSNPYSGGLAPVPVDISVSVQHSIHFSPEEVQDLLRAKRQTTKAQTVICLRVIGVVAIIVAVLSVVGAGPKDDRFNIPLLVSCAVLASALFVSAQMFSKRKLKEGGTVSKPEMQHIREIGLKRLAEEFRLHRGWPLLTSPPDGSNYYTSNEGGCIFESEYFSALLAKSYVPDKSNSDRYFHKDYEPQFPLKPFFPK